MKSEVDPELLKEYVEGEVAAEEELFARYDRELAVPDDLWAGIEARIAPVGQSRINWWMPIAAVLVLCIGLGFLFLLSQKDETIASIKLPGFVKPDVKLPEVKPAKKFSGIKKPIRRDKQVVDNPGVFATDLGGPDIDEQDTAQHIERTENLLRSIRNFPIPDTDDEIDVSYDKALSRRLLIENVVLRREAEMKAKFPTKTLLADLEPLLIDIANLPDHAKPEELRAIKERVQKTEIVAALIDFQAQTIVNGPNNR